MIKNKNIVVTGATRGIGKEIAFTLVENGANVAINYRTFNESIERLVEDLRRFGTNVVAIKCDISSEEDIKRFIVEAKKQLGTIDVLVNNAGITKDGLLVRMKETDFQDVLDVNLKGTFMCTREVATIMMKQRYGKIINISSVVGVIGNAGQCNYAASKAGVIGFSKSAARELAGRNITVNVIAPGFIKTDMTEGLNESVKETMLKGIPLKRIGEPKDIANLVLFLSSDLSNYITGQVINVDGGMVMN